MKFERLIELVGDEPLFESGLLMAGDVDPDDIQRQLSRWTRAGRIVQLRKGFYALARPYRKIAPHPFVVANSLAPGSYVSVESALAHHGLIPEYVAVTTSVTPGRPGRWSTPLGIHHFRHVKRDLAWGYRATPLCDRQQAFVATPEKALLDLVHLRPGADSLEFLRELRLQNLDRLDLEALRVMARRTGSPKLLRAAERVAELARIEVEEYEAL